MRSTHRYVALPIYLVVVHVTLRAFLFLLQKGALMTHNKEPTWFYNMLQKEQQQISKQSLILFQKHFLTSHKQEVEKNEKI